MILRMQERHRQTTPSRVGTGSPDAIATGCTTTRTVCLDTETQHPNATYPRLVRPDDKPHSEISDPAIRNPRPTKTERNRANSKGMLPNGRKRSSSEQFFYALHAIYDHPDFLALSKTARAFLWEVARLHNGFNNGNLSVAYSIMGPRGWDKKTIARCKDELVRHNWLEVTRWPQAKRQPILYRLTWLELGQWQGKPYLDGDAKRQKIRSLKSG